MSGEAEQQAMRVYLRVRPFSREELSDNEDQDCIAIKNSQTVLLNAPKGSASMKSSERGVGIPVHKFTFSQIFGPETTQAELFEKTVKSQLVEFLKGKNTLIFAYGVTNAGKTYTVQGTQKEPGILPRVLDATFQFMGGHQYEGMDLKPHLRDNVLRLHPDQVKQERSTKAAIFAPVKDDSDHSRASGSAESSPFSATSLSSSVFSYNPTELASIPMQAISGQFALWVAYFEIYNECVYDLLQPSFCLNAKKRSVLRVCDDGAGNAYVKDLKWINIQSLSEAFKILQFGDKNRSAAATKMNQSSSRSHSIFTMKLLKIDEVVRISEFSLCDLAGSERCNKAKTFGERLKEAGNINNSLHILGKCITALRNNQTDRTKSSYIPFRESKLTKLFQSVFCGKGRASMIVNINQCASTYDETLHVMKFSAVARQVVQVNPVKPLLESLSSLARSEAIDHQGSESSQEEDDEADDDAVDVSLLPADGLLILIENLQTKLQDERRKNLMQETEIRKEMGDAMLQQLMESEELRNKQIEDLKESYQDKLENTFEMYKDAIKDHAYKCAMSNLEDDYVPLEEFIAEQEKVEALRRKVSELESLSSSTGVPVHPTSHQPQLNNPTEEAGNDQCKRLQREKCALEQMCVDKQEVILCLEKRLMETSETMKRLSDDYLEKSAEVEILENKERYRVKYINDLVQQNADKEKEITLLKEKLEKLSQKSPEKPKTKRGLLANIRDVTSPKTSGTLRKIRNKW